jgi:hypothetical protein
MKFKLGFDNMFTVDCKGLSGGLILLWNFDMDLEIQNFSQQHVNAVINSPELGFSWKFTSFYGNPDPTKREESWSLLRILAGLNLSH